MAGNYQKQTLFTEWTPFGELELEVSDKASRAFECIRERLISINLFVDCGIAQAIRAERKPTEQRVN